MDSLSHIISGYFILGQVKLCYVRLRHIR